jgi:dihydroxyacid dehydratase/phosphogluconate dehydratase
MQCPGERDWDEIEDGIARSPGHCMTMGTASSMTSAVEALGLSLPGAASIPAADSNHAKMASACGRRIVDMVWEDATPASLLGQSSFDNAVTAVLACGGSTNAIIHLIAMARRAGIALDLDRFDPGAGRSAAGRTLSDGRLLLRRWSACAAGIDPRAARS